MLKHTEKLFAIIGPLRTINANVSKSTDFKGVKAIDIYRRQYDDDDEVDKSKERLFKRKRIKNAYMFHKVLAKYARFRGLLLFLLLLSL